MPIGGAASRSTGIRSTLPTPLFCDLPLPPPPPTLSPYTTLFRSLGRQQDHPGRPDRGRRGPGPAPYQAPVDRKSTRVNSSHAPISYAVVCFNKKVKRRARDLRYPPPSGGEEYRTTGNWPRAP